MASHRTKLEDRVLWIQLEGLFDESTARESASQIWDELQQHGASVHVVFDLSRLDDCQILARTALIELQQRIARTKRRTAWMSSRPRFRGLGLLVSHGAEDPRSKPVTNDKEALAWLHCDEVRLDPAARLQARISDQMKKARNSGGGSR